MRTLGAASSSVASMRSGSMVARPMAPSAAFISSAGEGGVFSGQTWTSATSARRSRALPGSSRVTKMRGKRRSGAAAARRSRARLLRGLDGDAEEDQAAERVNRLDGCPLLSAWIQTLWRIKTTSRTTRDADELAAHLADEGDEQDQDDGNE